MLRDHRNSINLTARAKESLSWWGTSLKIKLRETPRRPGHTTEGNTKKAWTHYSVFLPLTCELRCFLHTIMHTHTESKKVRPMLTTHHMWEQMPERSRGFNSDRSRWLGQLLVLRKDNQVLFLCSSSIFCISTQVSAVELRKWTLENNLFFFLLSFVSTISLLAKNPTTANFAPTWRRERRTRWKTKT